MASDAHLVFLAFQAARIMLKVAVRRSANVRRVHFFLLRRASRAAFRARLRPKAMRTILIVVRVASLVRVWG